MLYNGSGPQKDGCMSRSSEWMDYSGAGSIGLLIGLWLRFCLWPLRVLFRLLFSKRKSTRLAH